MKLTAILTPLLAAFLATAHGTIPSKPLNSTAAGPIKVMLWPHGNSPSSSKTTQR